MIEAQGLESLGLVYDGGMSGFFYKLGRMAGPRVRKGKWVWRSLTGDEGEILEAEHEVGRDLAAAFAAQLGVEPSAEVRRYVAGIGGALAGRVREKRRKFRFTVASGGEPNAFALPGGERFVSRSLLELIGGERDPLAFILGHEMAHVIKRHPMDRVLSDAALSSAARTVRLGGVAGQAVGGWVTGKGVELMRSAYSRERELAADQLGARLARAAGFDPAGAVHLMERLKAVSVESDRPLGEYFSTHPPFDQRIAALRKL